MRIKYLLSGFISIKDYKIMKLEFKEIEKIQSVILKYQYIIIEKKEDLKVLYNGINDFWNVNSLWKKIQRENGIMMAMVDGNIPIAFGAALKRGGNGVLFRIRKADSYVGALYTYPQFRGKKVMQMFLYELLKQVEKKWDAKNTVLCVMPDNIPAQMAYQKVGFHFIGERKFLRVLKLNIPYYRI